MDTYTRYKQIEGEFIKWLKTASANATKGKTPNTSIKWTTTALKSAVNYVKEKSISVPQNIFQRLNQVIHLRHETKVNFRLTG